MKAKTVLEKKLDAIAEDISGNIALKRYDELVLMDEMDESDIDVLDERLNTDYPHKTYLEIIDHGESEPTLGEWQTYKERIYNDECIKPAMLKLLRERFPYTIGGQLAFRVITNFKKGR